MLKNILPIKDESHEKYWLVVLITLGVALFQLLAGIAVFYFTVKTAVKNGTRQALEEFNQDFEDS